MATPWIYCCRCGTRDIRGSHCEKGPHLGKKKTCHGVAGNLGFKRHWAFTPSSFASLDGFSRGKVEIVLAHLALDVTAAEQLGLADELRDEVVPVRVGAHDWRREGVHLSR